MHEMFSSIRLPESLLKASDVAEVLNISVPMAYRLMQRNEIRTVRIGKSRRVREEDLLTFIEENLSFEN